jgi:replicative DNA helicase
MTERRHSIEAEQQVLGAVLLSAGRALQDVSELVPEDFYRPAHEALWARLLAFHAAGQPLEAEAVGISVLQQPIGTMPATYIRDLVAACSSPAGAAYYGDIVRKNARLRRLQAAAERALHLASEASLEAVEEAVDAIRGDIDKAATDTSVARMPAFHELVLAAMDRWEKPDQRVMGTGLYDFDSALSGGLRPGHLVVFGARPAVGKSVVGAVLAHAVAKHGVGSLMVSLEMTVDEVVDRVMANAASVDVGHLTESKLTEDDWAKVSRVAGRASGWPLWVDDRAHLTVGQVKARARSLKRDPAGLGLVVVDYLQIVRPGDDRTPREQQVSGIARDLKILAKDLDVPVIALAQVGRQSTTGTDKRPEMHHLRESGGIEAHADEIVLLHRDDEEMPGEIEFNVVKNRHGRTGRIVMGWAPYFSRVTSLART